MGCQGVLSPSGPKVNVEIRDTPIPAALHVLHHSPSSGGYSQSWGHLQGVLSLPTRTLRFVGTQIREKHPGDPQIRGITGSTQLQPTLFEGSSFNAAFRMGMASLYSPC